MWSGRSPIGLREKNRSLRVEKEGRKGRKKITAVVVFMQMTSFLVTTNHLYCCRSGLLLPIENRQQRDEHSRYEVNAVVVLIVQTEDQLLYMAASSELFCVKNGKKTGSDFLITALLTNGR